MKLTRTLLLFLLVGLFFSCEEENESPVISFTRPVSDTLVREPKRVVFEVTAVDPDGDIKQVDFHLNGDPMAKVDPSYPYDCYYDFNSDEHTGTNTVTAVAHDFDGGQSSAEIKVIFEDFRDNLIGNYSGVGSWYYSMNLDTPAIAYNPNLGGTLYETTGEVFKDYPGNMLDIDLESTGNALDYFPLILEFNYEGVGVRSGVNGTRMARFDSDSLHIITLKYVDTGSGPALGFKVQQYGLAKVQ